MKAFWRVNTRRQPGITFGVDNVISVTRTLPDTTLDRSLKMRSDCDVRVMPDREAAAVMTPQMQTIERMVQRNAAVGAAGNKSFKTNLASSFTHPLIEAVHIAFSEHRPLILSPDAIWLVIAQGFGTHVRENAEALRLQLVRHQDKKELCVEAAMLDESHWQDSIAMFSRLIHENSDPVLHETLVCDFSTTTPTIRTASEVALMDAFEPFFEYSMICICGIPKITLTGTVEDWQRMRSRVEVLATYDLEWWISRVRPILDEFVRAAEGRPNRKFWRAIYKPEKSYFSDISTGWICDLFPYLGRDEKYRNPTFTTSRVDWVMPEKTGVGTSEFGSGISRVPIKLTIGSVRRPVEVMGGYFGVGQDAETKALFPIISWAVVEPASPREHSAGHNALVEMRRTADQKAQDQTADS